MEVKEVKEVKDMAVTTLKPQIDLRSFWISRQLTDYKERLFFCLPLMAGGGTAHLNSSCVDASTAASGKQEKQDVKNEWEESVQDRQEVR